MVLTQNQKTQLNKDILEHIANNGYSKSAEIFAQQAEIQLNEVDPEGKKLEIKWKSILSLQKKITMLEQKVKGLQEDLGKFGGGGALPVNGNLEDLYMIKTPAKYEMKGHKGVVTSLAFHPQYTQMASSSDDGSIKIWEFETGDF